MLDWIEWCLNNLLNVNSSIYPHIFFCCFLCFFGWFESIIIIIIIMILSYTKHRIQFISFLRFKFLFQRVMCECVSRWRQSSVNGKFSTVKNFSLMLKCVHGGVTLEQISLRHVRIMFFNLLQVARQRISMYIRRNETCYMISHPHHQPHTRFIL